jgi:hypothetical protein
MDTSDPEIGFDEEGVCHHWHEFQERMGKELYNGEEGRRRAQAMASDIKRETKGKRYDCLIGLSGGVDSSYVAWVVVKELGLRPLAVHMDNGWNTELAVSNIERIVKKLDIDLHTEVLDWEEFRELQKAFFRASVGNVEMATDHAINATLFGLARRFNIRHIPHRSAKKSLLQLPKLLPIQYLRMQVNIQFFDNPLNVRNCQFGIPAIIHMHRQRPQPQFLHHHPRHI